MGLKSNDLKDTILKKVSIDEFEPKTGDSKDVIVIGLHALEQSVGEDLYSFLNSSIYEIRDVEVSPNPNKDGYFMVFLEIDRNEESLKTIRSVLTDVENVTGKLSWQGKTHLTDDFHPIFEDEIEKFLITDPENYMTKDEWIAQVEAEEAEEAERQQEEERNSVSNQIMEFMKASNLLGLEINENYLSLNDSRNTAKLEIIKFGNAKDVMEEVGISESAIGSMDINLRMFNQMLGEMKAIPVNEYIVIFHPQQQNVLVTKKC